MIQNKPRSRHAAIYASIFSVLLVSGLFLVNDASAQQSITLTGEDIGKTNILTLENHGNTNIGEIRMWPSAGAVFESFRVESGWSGDINSVGVLVLVADPPMGPDKSTRFIVVTDTEGPTINWKAVGPVSTANGGGELQTSLLRIGSASPPPGDDTHDDDRQPPNDVPPDDVPPNDVPPDVPDITPQPDIRSYSTLKVVPPDPGRGDTVRIVGTGFAPGAQLSAFFESTTLPPSFTSDADGNFVITRDIPTSINARQASVGITSVQGDEISSRITITDRDRPEPTHEPDDIDSTVAPLEVTGASSEVEWNEPITLSGTGEPGRWVLYEIREDSRTLLTTGIKIIDSAGLWSVSAETPVHDVADEYAVYITDGLSTINRDVNISVSGIIEITAERDRYVSGQDIVFTGTLIPNREAEIILEDPIGHILVQRTIDIDSDGDLTVEYDTSTSSQSGTYILIVTQDTQTVVAKTGLDEPASSAPIVILDDIYYDANDDIVAHIFGEPNISVTIELFDDEGQPKNIGQARNEVLKVNLGPTGSTTYIIDPGRLSTGEYSVAVSWGGNEHEDSFVIESRLPTDIRINVSVGPHKPGSSIPVNIATSNPYSTIALRFLDPDSNIVMSQETFTNKDSSRTVMVSIPEDGEEGEWAIQVGGTMSTLREEVGINVLANIREGLFVRYDGIANGLLSFSGTGAGGNSNVKGDIEAILTNDDGDEVRSGTFPYSSSGEFSFPMREPNEAGEYTLTVDDGRNRASVEFDFP